MGVDFPHKIGELAEVDKQSFTNLLENGDFESWSAGAAAAPDGWTLSGGATIAREGATIKVGTYSVKLIASAVGDRLNCVADDYVRYRGRVVTFGAWVYASAAGAKIGIADGVSAVATTEHSGTPGWEWLTVTHTANAGATAMQARLYPDTSAGTGTTYFDGAILVEGSVCPAFSPKPLVDDHQSIVIDSATNKVTLGNLLVCEPSSDATITAAGGITPTHAIMRIVSSGGAVNITANPQIVAGSDGQLLIVQGTSDANTVQLDDGTGLILEGAVAFVLGANDMIMFAYDSGESAWIEINRSNN